MDAKEILEKLKEGANFELKYDESGCLDGFGAINRFEECKLVNNPDWFWYEYIHYPAKKKILESLPWTKIVEHPYTPNPDEYPKEDGDYITMLDCNDHAVWHNIFRDGHWLIYNKTHVKWWMPITDEMKEIIKNNTDGKEENS